jgi:hypothetical protein
MARKHAFFIVVLLAAAAMAGFVAVMRTVDLAQPATATATAPLTQSALEARLRDLDRFEARLRKQLAAKPPARTSSPTTLDNRVAAPASFADDEDDDEYEDEEGEEDDD